MWRVSLLFIFLVFFVFSHSLSLSFPSFHQDTRRLLITINSASESSKKFLSNQFQSYLTLCERGYEIHIVIITLMTSREIKEELYCQRLQAKLPILIDSVSCNLAARHRDIFLKYQKNYDYYLAQEDDMLITPDNIAYWMKWRQKFDNTIYYPGFAIKEYLINQDGFQDDYWMSFSNVFRKMRLIHLNGSDLLIHSKAWVPFYLLTKKMLQTVSSQSDWLTDQYQIWQEYNVHFMHFWLIKYYTIAIPVENLLESYVHHQPNRYIQLASHPDHVQYSGHDHYNGTHQHMVTIYEFSHSLADILQDSSLRLSGKKWNVNTIFKPMGGHRSVSSSTHSVGAGTKSGGGGEGGTGVESFPNYHTDTIRKCLSSGKEVFLELLFLGETLEISRSLSRSVTVEVGYRCIQSPSKRLQAHFLPNSLHKPPIEINRCPHNHSQSSSPT